MESPGALPSGACFSSWFVISIDTGQIAKSTNWPKMESCFQDRACSVSSFRSTVQDATESNVSMGMRFDPMRVTGLEAEIL